MSVAPSLRPAWIDERLFPFESRFLEVGGHLLHYVSEGSWPVLLMLHGNPAWSFLFRHLIVRLRDRYQCASLWTSPGSASLEPDPDTDSRLPSTPSWLRQDLWTHLSS